MTSPLPHAPSEPVGASQTICAGPPATATFFSLPSAMKPRYRLSGDQNGPREFSVPGITLVVSAFIGCSQIMLRLVESCATYAIILPSGEMTGWNCGVRPEGTGTVN